MRLFLSTFLLLSLLSVTSLGGGLATEPHESRLAQPEVRARDFGNGLRWKEGTIRLAVSDSLLSSTNIKAGSDIAGVIERSLRAWESVANIDFVTTPSERDSVSPSGLAGDGVSLLTIAGTNDNVLFFAGNSDSLSAKTRVFFNRRGQITEADIALNPFVQFSTDGTYGTFDLETTLRHEIGHLLGLGHSPIAGAVMYEGVGRNGVLTHRALDRALSADDIAAARAMYGSRQADTECCGSIAGKLTFPGKAAREITVWAQDKASGRVAAYARLSRNRGFRIGGLESGRYELFASESVQGKVSAAHRLGEASVAEGSAAILNAKFVRRSTGLTIEYAGADGLMADAAVQLKKGERRNIMIGGTGLKAENLLVSSSSQFISIHDGSISNVDYADGVSGLMFEIEISPDTPAGTYSIYVVTPSGDRQVFLGGIVVSQ